jgi:uncharacterized protein YlxP (DUF503 family)
VSIGVLTLYLHIPGCASLKEKRRRIKPLLARIHREFNVSTAEVDLNDTWQSAVIACAIISNDPKHARRSLMKITTWIERHRPDVDIMDDQLEII